MLREKARAVTEEEILDQTFSELISDMVDTLHDSGGIGLAAPQVGESIQIVVVEIPGGETRYGFIPPLPLTTLINPIISITEAKEAGYWEGCLSIPGLRGFVERPQGIHIEGLGPEGNKISLQFDGFLATVLQHELDHLDGKLYIDNIKSPELLVYEEEYLEFIAIQNE